MRRAAERTALPGAGGPACAGVPVLRIGLLGGFRLERVGVAETAADWQRRSVKTLTKLLATCPGHAMRREQIVGLLWPEASAESALNGFAKTLHAARRALEPGLPRRKGSAYLLLADARLALSAEHLVVDADEFEQRAGGALRSRGIATGEAALAGYGGELLPEDCYEGWCADRGR